jgi:RHS repeat-associated protein
MGAATKAAVSLLVWSFAAAAGAQVVEYYHVDAVGSVRALTSQAGQVIERHDYLPFGEECTTGPCASNPGLNAGQPRKYTGKERDKETGLDYFGARYYGSKIGRFTTTDPVCTWSENLVDPQRWNRYAYGRNNPLRYVDPDGRVLVLVGTQSARTQASAIANGGLFGQQLVIASNGVASLQSTSIQGPPTAQQAAMADVLRTAINDPKTTSISLSEGSSSTAAGSFLSKDIDVKDVAAFGRGPVTPAAAVFGHEIAEQHAAQVGGQSFPGAHAAGTRAQSAISGWTRGAMDTSGITNWQPLTGTTRTTLTQGKQTRDVTVKWNAGNVDKVTQ